MLRYLVACLNAFFLFGFAAQATAEVEWTDMEPMKLSALQEITDNSLQETKYATVICNAQDTAAFANGTNDNALWYLRKYSENADGSQSRYKIDHEVLLTRRTSWNSDGKPTVARVEGVILPDECVAYIYTAFEGLNQPHNLP